MRYTPLTAKVYLKNRANFSTAMEKNTIAILTANDVKHTNADDVMGFAQNNDLLYLSGIDQEETILLIYPDAYEEANKVILFVKEASEISKIWDGALLSKEKAAKLSGIDRVEWIHDFETILQSFAFEADGFYLGHNEHKKRVTKHQETRQDRFIKWCKEKYPLHNYYRVSSITRLLRPIKDEEELKALKKAVSISAEGFTRVLKTLKPGLKEYEIEAELTYALVKNGAQRHAFKPIVASGKNACVLHYNTNHNICKDGEMLLIDFGVCYANYNSDTTRCLPVNGVFSKRQKEVYSSVLHCLKQGSKFLVDGVTPKAYEEKMVALVENELINLGVISHEEIAKQDPKKPLFKKYFMHGTAHFLGLDVHDVGLYSQPFKAGMVVTCEPGIYLPEEGIGCRLENDYVITKTGEPINLSEALPIEIDEIEALMSNN